MTGIRLARNTSAAVVAVIAAWSSYSHMTEVALKFGERADVAYVLPFSVDGLMVVASVTMVDDKQAGRRPRTSARAAFLAGVLASVGANIAAAHPDLGARIVAGWPALALLLVVEMLSRSGKSASVAAGSGVVLRPVLDNAGLSDGVRDSGPPRPGPQGTKVESMTRIFHEALASGRVLDHRELARAAEADLSHARRVHRRLVAEQSSWRLTDPSLPMLPGPGCYILAYMSDRYDVDLSPRSGTGSTPCR